ncbi:hypothetical protein SUGI_0177790 [Cryptomeria japonica]|nr:hypothetical protein SUGI_0177790 [Cryptomeria japonica]
MNAFLWSVSSDKNERHAEAQIGWNAEKNIVHGRGMERYVVGAVAEKTGKKHLKFIPEDHWVNGPLKSEKKK